MLILNEECKNSINDYFDKMEEENRDFYNKIKDLYEKSPELFEKHIFYPLTMNIPNTPIWYNVITELFRFKADTEDENSPFTESTKYLSNKMAAFDFTADMTKFVGKTELR